MSLPKYPEYRESGVEWLGDVPAHWQVDMLRRRATLNPSKSEIGDGAIDRVVSFLPMEAVGERGELDLSRTRPIGEVSTGYTYFREGDVAFAKITPCFENGKGARMVGLHGGLGFGTTELTVVRPQRTLLDGRYLDWVLRSVPFRQRGEAAMYGAGGQKRVPDEFVREFSFAWPSAEEQQTIATFLDRETAKIDALIAEQEKLIVLLTEKRQATISHAVTKGLDPNAPMKDSGIPWLGEVPAEWEILPLKRDVAFLTSGSRGWAEHYSNEGALFLRIGNLTRDSVELDLSDVQRVEPPEGSEGERTRVSTGDVLFSITAYLGSVAVVPGDVEVAYVSQHVALARLRGKHFLPKWIGYATLSSLGKTYLANQGYGGTKVQLSLDDIACLPVTVPSLPEQQATLDFLEKEIRKLDVVRAESEAAIRLLCERRSALIAAAVTGQIDVRGFVEAQAA